MIHLLVTQDATLTVSQTGNIIYGSSGSIVNNGTINNSASFIKNTRAVTNNGTITGDPYIQSANGKITKTPNRHGFYRLFENGDIYMNCEVDELDISESLQKFLELRKFSFEGKSMGSLIDTGFWNKAVYIESEGHCVSVDLFKNVICKKR